MAMPGRSFSSDKYRYGFNGKEKDKDINSGGVAFEARIYDSRIGRFFTTDPREVEYAWQSTYVYHRNSPIKLIDFLGMGDPPDIVYHRTTSANAASERLNGFDATKSTKSGLTFFTKKSSASNIGAVAKSHNTVVSVSTNLDKAVNVSEDIINKIWVEGISEANKKLGTHFGSLAEIQATKGKSASQAFRIVEGYFNKVFSETLSKSKGEIFKYSYLGEETYAMKASAVKNVKVVGFFGKGAAEAQKLYRLGLLSKAASSVKSFVKPILTTTLVWEVGIPYALEEIHKANKNYVKGKSVKNWLTDTYSMTGLWYYYNEEQERKEAKGEGKGFFKALWDGIFSMDVGGGFGAY